MAPSTRENSSQNARTVVGVTRARQGFTGRHIFWVLVFGTLLAGLALFAAWTWRSGDLASTEPNNARQAADAAPFESAPPAEATLQAPPVSTEAPPAR